MIDRALELYADDFCVLYNSACGLAAAGELVRALRSHPGAAAALAHPALHIAWNCRPVTTDGSTFCSPYRLL